MDNETNQRLATNLVRGFWGGVFLLGLIAILTVAWLNRYQVYTTTTSSPPYGIITRLDRFTGRVDVSTVYSDRALPLDVGGWDTINFPPASTSR